MADRKKAYRLNKPALCKPVVMMGFPSRKWIRPHHFVPLQDTGAKHSVGSEFSGSRRRSCSRYGTIYSVVPEVVKSSTSSTSSSTIPERNESAGRNCEGYADDTRSFSDLNQREAQDFFLFDFDQFDDEQPCWDECSYSTVSTKSHYLHGQSIDMLSFENFTEDDFEDAQQCTNGRPTSPFLLCLPSGNPKSEKSRDSEDHHRTIRKSRPVQNTRIATFGQTKHIFPPIDRPKKPPQVPMVVANPIAIVKTPTKVASPSKTVTQKQHPSLHDGKANAAVKATIGLSTMGEEDGIALLDSRPRREKYLNILKVGLPTDFVRLETAKDAAPIPVETTHSKQANAGEVQRFRVDSDDFDPDPALFGPSLWNQIGFDEDWLRDIVVGQDKLKMLFQMSPSSKPLSTNASRCQLIRIIEPKRAKNCAIFLASLNLSRHEIASSVDQFNHAAFTSDQIQELLKFLPTEKETEALKAYLDTNPNPLYLEAECYMVEMIKVEDAAKKLDVMATMKRFLFCCQSVTSGTSDSIDMSPC
jgi:hypothetical protein